jgi:hypothetical protein
MPKSSSLKKNVQDIGATLKRLEGQLRALVPALAKETKASVTQAVAKPARRKLRLSPERRRALKLQGSYLGYMRQLKPTQKAKVKAVKAKKGMRAAIAMARRLAGA